MRIGCYLQALALENKPESRCATIEILQYSNLRMQGNVAQSRLDMIREHVKEYCAISFLVVGSSESRTGKEVAVQASPTPSSFDDDCARPNACTVVL